MSMKSFLTGFLSVRQKSARGGRGLTVTVGLRAAARRRAAAAASPPAPPAVTPAAANAVAQPSLIAGRSDGATDGRVDRRWTLPRGPPGGEDGYALERRRAAAALDRRRSGDDDDDAGHGSVGLAKSTGGSSGSSGS